MQEIKNCKNCKLNENETKFPKFGKYCYKCKRQNSRKYEMSIPPRYQDDVKNFIGILKEAEKIGVNASAIKHQWLKTKEGSSFIKNPLYKDPDAFNLEDIDFKTLFGNIEPIKINKVNVGQKIGIFDKLIITDVHVGMDASNKGQSLYDVSWNKEKLFNNLEICINHVIEFQKSKILYIAELGDFFDGFNGLTTRGGHQLPQNMTNNEAFENGLLFKVTMIKELLKYYDKIIFRSVTNNNHGGSFDEICSTALFHYCNVAFGNKVEIITQTKFIDYDIIDNRLFLYCHGKDKSHLKWGFKTKIDPNQINKIIGFLTANNLLNKGYDITFLKGDSHQFLLDFSSSDIFKYFNFPSFAPQSDWVATNFQKGQSGFVFFNYRNRGMSINDYFFD